MGAKKTSCTILYNLVGEDEFEHLRRVDPSTLPFEPEYPIDVKTAVEEYAEIAKALKDEGFKVELCNLEDNLARVQQFFSCEAPDVIFNLVELFGGDPGLESAVTGVFDLCAIPYTGATPFTLALCQRKVLTKHILRSRRIATPKFKLLRSSAIPKRHDLRYPIMVKPASEDASLGVEAASVVYDFAQLSARVSEVYERFEQPVLIEEFIEGREFHVSVFGNRPPAVLPILEYDFSALPENHPPIITYDVKWNPLTLAYHSVHSRCPAELTRKVEGDIKSAALQAYAATYCRDYARVDVRLSKEGRPYVLEVNPNPDLTEGVSFMESAEKAGFSFSQTLKQIVEFALARRP